MTANRSRTALALVLALSLPLSLFAQAERTAYRPDVPGTQGLVTAGHPLAATAGLRMLLLGGNAIDAAVATLATLNVVRPANVGRWRERLFHDLRQRDS